MSQQAEKTEFEVAMKRLAEANQRITVLEDAVEELQDTIDDLEDQHGGQKARWGNILQYAAKAQRNGEDVALDYKQIAAAAGSSFTTAYKDIEEIPEQYDGVWEHETPSGETRLVIDGSRLTPKKHDDD